MMQRGRQIICGNAGMNLGDSMYDGEIYVAGKVRSLGVDCVPGDWGPTPTPELIERKFRVHGLGDPARVPEVRVRQAAPQLRRAGALRAQARDPLGGIDDV